MTAHTRAKGVLTLLATALLAGGIVAGCGDDDDGGDVAKLQIEATGGKGAVSYTVDTEEVAGGAAEIEFVNSSENDTDAQLAYTADEHSDEEVIAELGNAVSGQPLADWFEGGGGPGQTPAGGSSVVTQDLQPGTYYVLGANEEPEAPLTKFTVSDEDGAELPEADGTVSAQEYSFSSEGLKAGTSNVLLENRGAQWHHFLAAQLKPDATIEQAQQFFQTEEGPPPFVGEPGQALSSTVLEGGSSQIAEVELEPGRYAFFCFISDKQGGPPHVAKGMVSEVEVTE